MTATEGDSKQLAQKGYTAFREVLSGDEAKLPDAIRYMEQAKASDENNVPNLYNLGRAYFFDGITFKEESIQQRRGHVCTAARTGSTAHGCDGVSWRNPRFFCRSSD
jgi:hypothetical protein